MLGSTEHFRDGLFASGADEGAVYVNQTVRPQTVKGEAAPLHSASPIQDLRNVPGPDPPREGTTVSYRLETPSMGKAPELPLKQTRFGGKSNWVRCDVLVPVCSRSSANEPPHLSLQAQFA